MTSNLFNPTDLSELDGLLQSSTVVVDCYAPWCAPCKIIGPMFEQISTEHRDVCFIKLNIEMFSEFAQQHGIRNIPTIIIFKNNKVSSKHIGFTSEQKLRDFITNNT